jgi:hypothetical protein
MNSIHRHALIAAACSAAWAGLAGAQITTAAGAAPAGNSAVYLNRTQDRFGGFAGSNANAESLATGLRDSKPVTLTDGVETATFTPPTRPMGNGNVTRAMDLAQRDLAAAGITEPTPTQIKIAMMGGEITRTSGGTTTTTSFQGVLQLRSEGMGWGKIAHTIGVHPGMGKSTSVAMPAPHSAAVGASGAKSGIVTAAGGSSAAAGGNGRALGHGARTTSVTTAAGAGAGAGAGGVVTAKGSAGQGNGNAFGRSK